MAVIVDLIYVRAPEADTLTCAMMRPGHDKMLGPVPYKAGVAVLAPLLAAELPDRYPTENDAALHLTVRSTYNYNGPRTGRRLWFS